MRLFIAEKPSVANAIAAELGQPRKRGGSIEVGSDVVTWCFGHLLETAQPQHYDERYKNWCDEDLPIVPATWKLLPKEDSAEQLDNIGQLLRTATEVVHVGDPDREGQLLVDQVLQHFGWRGRTDRLWLNETHPVAIQRALGALKPNAQFESYGQAALARSRGDWLIGMNLTRAMTLAARRNGVDKVLSVGRVQTPTLAIVVQRDRLIENFKPVQHFVVLGHISSGAARFRAKWEAKPDGRGLDADGRLVDAGVAAALERATTGQQGVVRGATKEAKTSAHPLGYSLTSLTLRASQRFGMTADDVLKTAQSLYETHKVASYPRSDCEYLPTTQLGDAPRVLAAIAKQMPQLAALVQQAKTTIRSRVWNDEKVDAHHAIIPTLHSVAVDALNTAERNVYEMIARNYIAQFLPLHAFDASRIELDVAGETFVATGKVVTAAGWRDAFGVLEDEDEKEDDDIPDNQALPALQEGWTVTCDRTELKAKKTTPPPRFTEGTLIAAMKSIAKFVDDADAKKLLKDTDGIGTSATRAKIIEELKRRNFLEPKGKAIVSSAIGREFIDALPVEIRSPVLTATFERTLQDIQDGNAPCDAFVSAIRDFTAEHVARSRSIKVHMPSAEAPKCPTCGEGALRRRQSANGPFWGCTRYAEGCKTTFPDKSGMPDYAAREQHDCPLCKVGKLRKINGAKGAFWGCSRYAEGCKASFDDARGKPAMTKDGKRAEAKPGAKKAAGKKTPAKRAKA